MKDYKNEKMKANIWEKIAEEMRVMGYNVQVYSHFVRLKFLLQYIPILCIRNALMLTS